MFCDMDDHEEQFHSFVISLAWFSIIFYTLFDRNWMVLLVDIPCSIGICYLILNK